MLKKVFFLLKLFKYSSYKKELDLLIGRKIILFPLIVDIELIGDTTDIYKPFWSKLYMTAKQELEKNASSLQMIDIGETFTIAGSDSGSIYTWGSNDYYQLGRRTHEIDENISSLDQIFTNELKNPEKVYNFFSF